MTAASTESKRGFGAGRVQSGRPHSGDGHPGSPSSVGDELAVARSEVEEVGAVVARDVNAINA